MEERCEVNSNRLSDEDIERLLNNIKKDLGLKPEDIRAQADKSVELFKRVGPIIDLISDLTDEEYQQLLQTIRLIVGMVKHSREENNADGDKESTT